ncbi:ubiquitin--protein ligase [Dictyocaulus viviparus]|uniref:Ubiquitin-conjugating enzyme E2 J2 n=1 Tax=Dictyocaulus viviparus TaxID=29172 RepID=A0A0D8Y3I2_DICVI|nr:ubiquitin--protein ligase [Dictyocaulus viviparus]
MAASVTATARLKKDYNKLLKEPVPYVRAAPLQENILEWHYIIFGAPNTPYEGGVYHGKLVFPNDFPFKPPSIYMITPSGRFQVNTRLCLSISDFHPDTWNPAWTVSTIITGLLSFMNDSAPTLGSITSSDAEKKVLARRSKAFNLKDRVFCSLFPDVVEEIRKELNEANTAEEATLKEEDDRLMSAAEPSSGLSSLVSNLIVIAGVVVLAFAVLQGLEAFDNIVLTMSFLRKYLLAAIVVCVVCTLMISYNCSCDIERGSIEVSQIQRTTAASVHVLPETFFLIAIMSSPNDSAVRAVVRDTWLRLTKKGPSVVQHIFPIGVKNMKYVFYCKSEIMRLHLEEENKIHGDIALMENLEEAYNNLAHKTLKTMEYAYQNFRFQYILKVDSDSFVRLGAIIKALKDIQHPRLYWGFLDGRAKPIRKGKWREADWVLCDRYLPYQLGGGYVLSYELVRYLAVNARLFKLYKNEDVSVGAWLAGLDIKYVHDPRFDTEWKSRGCNNEYLITHKKSTDDMRKLYNNLASLIRIVNLRVLCDKEFRIRDSYVYDWTALPSECCHRRNGTNIP